MRLVASLALDEIRDLLAAAFPLKLRLGDDDEPDRWIRIDPPDRCVLVPGQGLEVDTTGTLRWPLAMISGLLNVLAMRVLLRPRVVASPAGQGLGFDLELEHFDLEHVPDLLDRGILRTVNARLRTRGARALWDFSRALRLRLPAPERIEDVEALRIRPDAPHLRVTADAIQIGLTLELGVER